MLTFSIEEGSELLEYLSVAQADFQRVLQERLRRLLGHQFLGTQPSVNKMSLSKSEAFGAGLADSVARDFTDAIGMAVTAAVSAAVGTISGGIGKTLGVAILSSLLGTSGPIGLLLGALLGLAAGGVAYWLGRDRLKGTVKKWKMPAALAKMALRDSRLQETRNTVYQSVKDQVQQELEPTTPTITNELVARLPSNLITGKISGRETSYSITGKSRALPTKRRSDA